MLGRVFLGYKTRTMLEAEFMQAMVTEIVRHVKPTFCNKWPKGRYRNVRRPEVLKVAKKKGLKLAVVSSTVSSRALPLLKNAGLLAYFDVKIFGDEVMKHKPLPDPYLTALEIRCPWVSSYRWGSFTGALSATQASLKVFLVPDCSLISLFRCRTSTAQSFRHR